MHCVQLVPLDAALIDEIVRGNPTMDCERGLRFTEVTEWVLDVAIQTARFYERRPRAWPWASYLAVVPIEAVDPGSPGHRQVVGVCSFKDGPSANGDIEIAYFTFPPFEGRGVATAMARELIAVARAQANPPRIIAHTLPQRNASTRVLERNGLRLSGEVIDPEDGRVWRWELPGGSSFRASGSASSC